MVSDTGLVKNSKNKILAINVSKRNHTVYHRVTLFKNNKRYYKLMHRLVAETFRPTKDKTLEIDHKDTNGANNNNYNLEWVTRAENIKRSFQKNSKQKLSICSSGGKQAAKTIQAKATKKYKNTLGNRFIEFHNNGKYCKDASITYLCDCGIKRTASIMWKEIRKHNGKCPICTNTTKRSSKSLR